MERSRRLFQAILFLPCLGHGSAEGIPSGDFAHHDAGFSGSLLLHPFFTTFSSTIEIVSNMSQMFVDVALPSRKSTSSREKNGRG